MVTILKNGAMISTVNIHLSDRFWNKVKKTNTCWLWTAGQQGNGYGTFRTKNPRRHVLAHRMAWELTYGPIPEGKQVCHHCDTRHCIRPDHLFLGTQCDNIRDAFRKGRFPVNHGKWNKGEVNGSAKLTAADVTKIRSMTGTQQEIANIFGINQSHVSRIKRCSSWNHMA
jgi:HNH endonuclease